LEGLQMKTSLKRWSSASLAVLAATAALTAGGSTATAATPATPAAVSLPASLKGQQLVSPVVEGYPPYAYLTKSNQSVGIDPDLSKALASPFRRPIKVEVASFENSLLGVESGKYFMVTGADITAAREKTYDMVPYLADHYEFASLTTSPPIGKSVTDLCGLTISTVSADSSIAILQGDSAKCKATGKKGIDVTTFPDQGSAVIAVESGRANATTATVTNLGYLSSQAPGKFRLGGPSYDFVYIGLATKKGNGVAKALAQGINELIANGTYHSILVKYGVEADAIKKATVNPNPTVTNP
jgi:polar amino acid transport system substrate-binding protein